ncbi:hypothetical protein QQY66_00630 [Streptomyces sp. DG2A-72]|uniref:hypothetical protein n=1 Tax=Streptomyces sp. DG2A-72 TaxID=3051386 RepID=UPI00265BBD4F|nr:hypothetical protein [Streptomyces sp. DG2A-72]MDO0930289.1 hypothetical protein [Streptomyces sp. DG2A-72]
MADPSGLRPQDRADFEAVLHLALNTPDILGALRADPTGRATTRLRLRALADADEITAAAYAEYRTYLTCSASNASAEETTPRRPAAGLVTALAVPTPPVAASSAAVLLLLDYLLQLTDVRGTLPGSLIAAGWILTLIAALSALIALTALLGTAIRGRGASAHPARLEQARLDWQQALLERGMLPHLRRSIGEDPLLHPAPPTATPTTDSKSGPPLTG